MSKRIKDTKTHETRDVDLSPDLDALLEDYVAALRHESLRNGWGDPEWLFPSSSMTPLDHNNVPKVFKRVLKRAKLPGFRLYDLRHTYASLLLAEGAPSVSSATISGIARLTRRSVTTRVGFPRAARPSQRW